MPDSDALLTRLLRNPERHVELDQASWDLLIRQARHANLLGRLAWIFDEAGLFSDIPERPRNHLNSIATLAARQHLALQHEVKLLKEALAPCDMPLILLKGAAYVLAGLPAAPGRVFADIDILVPKARLADAESALMLTGWSTGPVDPYDQRYYRTWMHELPPMQHIYRGSSLDVHHTILPPTAALKVDAEQLIDGSIEIAGMPGIRTLCPCDMVLHSATHLFHDGEADNLLRDLSDLDLLLRHFSADDEFWQRLLERARLLDLSWPLFLACRYTSGVLGTPIPASLLDQLQPGATAKLETAFLDAIYGRALRPQHASTEDAFSGLARKLLYIRAHWLRMPLHLLLYHLAHKIIFPPEVASTPLPTKLDPREEN